MKYFIVFKITKVHSPPKQKLFCTVAKAKWKHFASVIYLFYCCLGAPGAETGGGPEAGKGEGLAAELELGGPGLAAPPRVGEMKSEF